LDVGCLGRREEACLLALPLESGHASDRLFMLLDELETQSICVLREAFNKFERRAMLWCASHIVLERGHSCPPVGLRVDHHAKADKNVRAPVTRANNVGRM